MAVVVVCDFDAKEMEQKIIKQFGQIEKKSKPSRKILYRHSRS
jgi:predicted Zn-dependent peptidase